MKKETVVEESGEEVVGVGGSKEGCGRVEGEE
jgi:hypothetical protein